jgi:butyrate kinase
MKKSYKIFAINPGSTSTKIALFENDSKVFGSTLDHDSSELAKFENLSDQLPYRREKILQALAEQGLTLQNTHAFVGRGGGLAPLVSGTYIVNEILLKHARDCFAGVHPATLGAQLAAAFADEFGGSQYVVNPPDVDEFCDLARITGIKGIYRESRVHALNQKEIAIRYAASIGKFYDSLNLIVAHIGGGISVTAHKQGRMIDSNDILNGDGPFAPTRCGSIPVSALLKMDPVEVKPKITKTGGLADHLGTSDTREVKRRIEAGDKYAKLIYDAMIYQIAKQIGAMAAVLQGEIDAIIFTGGISNDNYLTDELSSYVGYLSPIAVMPGEFEMEALAAGALRVLRGEEQAKEYTGVPVWTGFDF